MIDYIKKELKHLPFTIIVFIMLYVITVFANSYALSSTDVSFDNDGTSITATNMQNAISELYDRAIDYSSIDTRVSDLESAVGNSTLTTTASTITGAINELEGKVTVIGNLTYLEDTLGSTDKTVPNMSQCRFIYAELRDSNSVIVNTEMIPYSIFASGNTYGLYVPDTNTANYITWKNNTTIRFSTTQSTHRIYVWCVK